MIRERSYSLDLDESAGRAGVTIRACVRPPWRGFSLGFPSAHSGGASVMKSRFQSFVSVVMSVGLMSCAGSAASPVASPTWQAILTVNTSSLGGFGIAGIALDGKGNLYLTEMDDALIYEYTTSGKTRGTYTRLMETRW